MIKDLPKSVIEAAALVLAPAVPEKKSHTEADKAAAIASIDQNVERKAISPEVAIALKKVWEGKLKAAISQPLEEVSKAARKSWSAKSDFSPAGGKKNGVHPLGVHTRYAERGSFEKTSNGARRAHTVVAVGHKVRGIKVGETLSDTDLDDMKDIGYKHKAVKEETDLLSELSKKTLGRYVNASSVSLANKAHRMGQRQGEHEVAQAGLGWVSDTTARRAAQDVLHTAKFDADRKERTKLNNRSMGIANAVKRLTKEEVEQVDELSKKTYSAYINQALDRSIGDSMKYARRAYGDKKQNKDASKERGKLAQNLMLRTIGVGRATRLLAKEEVMLDEAKLKQLHAVISIQHPIDDPEGHIGHPQILHVTGDHAAAHKFAKETRDKEFKQYPKGYKKSDERGGYHIHTDDTDLPAQTYHVSTYNHDVKEDFSNENEPGTVLVGEASVAAHELRNLLKAKVKSMTSTQQSKAAKLLNPKKPAVKEEIEADQNILVHLRKSIDTVGKHEVEFADGTKETIPSDVAESVLAHVLRLKPDARLEVQDYLQQSFENVLEVAQFIREGVGKA